MGRIVEPTPTSRGGTEPRPVRAGVWARAAVVLLAFVVIAVVGSWPQVVALNVEVLLAFQRLLPIGTVDPIALLLVFGSSQVSLCLLMAAGAWLYLRGDRLVALSFALLLVGVAVEVALKATLAHPMVWSEFSHGPGMYPFPEVKTTGVITLRGPFPSGHVFRASYLAMTAVAVLGYRLVGRGGQALTVGAGVFIAGIVFGVFYLGWHWPTDALGSLALAYALTAPTRWAVTAHGMPGIRLIRRQDYRGRTTGRSD